MFIMQDLASHAIAFSSQQKRWTGYFAIILATVSWPVLYVAFQSRRMQFKQWIMRWITSLSVVRIAFDSTEMRRIKQASVA